MSLAQGGWLAAANYLGYLAGALSAIWLSLHPARAIRGALLTIALSTLAMGLLDGFGVWLVLRTVAGIASAWVVVFASMWTLERLAQLGRPRLGGMFYAGVGSGVVIAGVACLVVMQLRASADAAWITLGAVAIALTAVIWATLGLNHLPGPVSNDKPRSAAWLLTACYSAYGFGYIVPATFLPAMARQIVADPLVFGWAWPVFGTAAALSTLAVSTWWGGASPRRVWIVSMLVMAAGVVAPLVLAGVAGILVSAVLVGGTFVTVTLAGMEEARQLYGTAARPVMAAMTSGFAIGQLAGPVIIALVEKAPHGFTVVLLAAAAGLVASAMALYRTHS